jgi:hypothetical protein
MTRYTLIALVASAAAGPWSGCDRSLDPVAPPAEPPTERAPETAEPSPQQLRSPSRRLV